MFVKHEHSIASFFLLLEFSFLGRETFPESFVEKESFKFTPDQGQILFGQDFKNPQCLITCNGPMVEQGLISCKELFEEEGIEIFYFSSFDESWKVGAEGDVGAYWGIWDKEEKLKF